MMSPSTIARLFKQIGSVVMVWLVLMQPATAAFDPKEMLSYRPFGDGEAILRFAASDKPVTVAELGPFAVVNYGKGDRCPAGGFYLVNTQRRYYQFVDAGSCSGSLVVQLSKPDEGLVNTAITHFLTFVVEQTIVARYPLYGY